MDTKQNRQFNWQQCEGGEVDQIVSRLKRRRLFRTLQRDIAVVTGLMLMLASGVVFSSGMPPQELDYGGIMCGDVDRHSLEFVKGSLDGEMQAQIEQHIKHCWHCQQRIANLRAGERQTPRDPGSQGEVYAYPQGGGVVLLEESPSPVQRRAAKAIH